MNSTVAHNQHLDTKIALHSIPMRALKLDLHGCSWAMTVVPMFSQL